jgi:hypothetical protein
MLSGLGMTWSDFLCDINPLCAVPTGAAEALYSIAPSAGQSIMSSSAAAAADDSDNGLSTTTLVLLAAGGLVALFLLMRR